MLTLTVHPSDTLSEAYELAHPLSFRRPAPLGMSGPRHKARLAVIFLSEVVLLAWHSIGLAVGNSLAGSFFQQAPCLNGAQVESAVSVPRWRTA